MNEINHIQAVDLLTEMADNGEIEQSIRVELYNKLSQLLFQILDIDHPILNVQLIPADKILPNQYNPNNIAPPEFRLLKHSVMQDGFTMPIVVNRADEDGQHTIIDGFHRVQLIKSNAVLLKSLSGYIPAVILTRSLEERISSSVRHNIARGTHQVELTAKLVIQLKDMNWSNEEIGIELGMDKDEVLRMQQITGLAAAFKDQHFSASWE